MQHAHQIAAGSHAHSITSDTASHTHAIDPAKLGAHSHSIAPAGGEHSHSVIATTQAHQDTPKADNEVDLDQPVKRGSMTIKRVALRRPSSGELRGLTLNALANLDVDAMTKLLPRISSPTLTRPEVEGLDPADLLQLSAVVGGFLLPKHAKASMDSQTA